MAFIRIEQIAAAAFALLMALSWPAMAQDKPAAKPAPRPAAPCAAAR